MNTHLFGAGDPGAAARSKTNVIAPDNFIHTVSYFQWFLDVVLRLKVPHALCGVSLEGNPDDPEPTVPCPACARY